MYTIAGSIEYLSGSSTSLAAIDWRTQLGFTGEETILGDKTYLIHFENEGNYTDSYIAPTFRAIRCESLTETAEARPFLKLRKWFRESPHLRSAPNLPISNERFDEKTRR